ncbi:hypothetical protein EDB89DRAFT_1904070 [Lactarius sanguifluus]|nr:hypothetical protein EDB89DRAFT_1904070 [Lactarius sanguifluus]
MFTAFARGSTLATLQRAVQVGCLEIEESGVVHRFGSPENSENHVRIVVLNDSFWKQIFLLISVHVLNYVSTLWLENESRMTSLNSVFKRLSSAVSGVYIALFGQTLTQARLNCITGYDQSNELFKAFLSKEMMYSSALFSEEEGGVHGDLLPQLRRHTADLEQAQLRKIHHVLRQARSQQVRKQAIEYGGPDGGGREGKVDMSWSESENAKTVREERFWPGNAQLAGRPLRFTGRNGEKLRSCRGIRRKVGSTGGPLTRSGEELWMWNRMQQAMKRGVLRGSGDSSQGNNLKGYRVT